MSETAALGARNVSRIGFGAMQLAGPGVFGPPRDAAAARAVLRRAIELGVDHIDTSQYYGPDVVNELIRETLAPYPENLALVTKVGARRDERGGWLAWNRPHELKRGVQDNLRTLGIERIAVNLRMIDHQDGSAADVPLVEQLGALVELREAGMVEFIGVSNVTRAALQEAIEFTELACVQNAYSILDRQGDDVRELAGEHGLAFVPFFPLGSAFTGGPAKLAAHPEIAAVAAKHDATPSQIALAWLLHRDQRILLIPGTTSVGHLEENLAAGEIALDASDLERLSRVEPVAGPHG
jgi:aryl-alcohol dehydrogenase-like predicted oxidoreductase